MGMFSNSPGTPPQTPNSRSVFKNPLLYSSIALGIAAVVVGWIFLSRWQENRDITRRTLEERTEKQREEDRRTVEDMGGSELEIQSFYASPGIIHRGETAQLCYGVANAKAVKLEPQSNPVWPSYGRCVDVSPKNDTTYTLTIADAAGQTKAQTVEVKVR